MQASNSANNHMLEFRCRRCSKRLFEPSDIVDFHELTDKQRNSGFSQKRPAQNYDCTSLNIQEATWFGIDYEEGKQEGSIMCNNPRCNQKIGRFCWHGLACSCGAWTTPAFQIHKSKIGNFGSNLESNNFRTDIIDKSQPPR
eukprot:Gregarina_sp_Poly_1__1541@NODE_138_length_13117_cov_118_636935_g123_i0_p10_GENE_NODE_138_length_13117_cov_118_636935_g123_i0NODE_138_length_13117_cov_118_636935_g123_i0_p10_ORF_typecomplete_len142_score12_53HECT_2/PF09814_9/0_68_NODE_138_length_13117_cov_118_636935_g123_i06321057